MIKFIILISIIIVFFMAFTFSRKIADVPVLIAVAIGCCVNANIFTSLSSPIEVGNLVFGMDSILYTIFIFTIIIRMMDYSLKDAQIMTLTSIAAILISALIEYSSILAKVGAFHLSDFYNLLKYVASTTGTFFAVWVIEKIYLKLNNTKINKYFMLFILISVGSIINTTWLYGFTILVDGLSGRTLAIFVGSIILRFISIVFSQISMLIYNKYLKKVDNGTK